MEQQAQLHSALNFAPAFSNPDFRVAARKTLKGFCLIYLNHYLYDEPAIFHPELVDALESQDVRKLEVLGFRGSAKSVFGSLALPLWAALERPDLYGFILPIADTGQQAALNIANIKNELEHNELIKQDYGQIRGDFVADWTLESEEEWQSKNMLLSNGVRILARSRGQKVRGLRHREHRPKLVVVDDPEDLEWVRKKENRDKTERWLKSEVIPAMDEREGKLVVIGNQLHTDALMSRIRKTGLFKVLEYALIQDERCTWPAKYPTKESLEEQKKLVGETAWQREYLLKVVPEEGQEVKPDEIHYYDQLPKVPSLVGTGVDYAISKKETADYTSAVSGTLSYEDGGRAHIDIHAFPLNERLDMQETISHMQGLQQSFGGNHIIYAEEVGYQKAANDEMERKGLAVERMQAIKDKRARLRVAAVYIKNGTVRFPRTGCEDLLMQLFGFGIEEHDDMVDALVYLILGLVNQGLNMEGVIAI